MTEIRPYGEWPSPITARMISEGTVSVGEVVPDGDCLWWSEHRPSTGRTVIMHLCAGDSDVGDSDVGDRDVGDRDVGGSDVGDRGDGEAFQATPSDVNVRTRVHEYGGGAWWAEGGVCYYSDDECLRKIAVHDKGNESGELADPVVLTQNEEGFADRWADMRLSGRWLICVRERHRDPHDETEPEDGEQDSEEAIVPTEIRPTNEIACVATSGSGEIVTLVSGSDFYAAPRPSPDGKHLAWLSWDLPDMPWNNTNLWVGELRESEVSNARCLAGKESSLPSGDLDEDGELGSEVGGELGEEWVFQPEWNGDVLTFVSDRGGWSCLWMSEFSLSGATAPRKLLEHSNAEIQVPPWVFGQSRYAHTKTGLVWATTRHALDELHFGAGVVFSECSSLASVRAWRDGVVALMGRWDMSPEIVLLTKKGGGVAKEVIRPASGPHFAAEFFPPPEMITFATGSGDSGSSTVAHALYFAPAHPEATSPEGTLAPLIVMAHGGPTGAARQELSWGRRYWTSRGFAVVDVDYRGSTGYGRQYRNSLDQLWGIADVKDCIAAARYLCDRGDVDPQRLAIRGGSAGGYSVLCALTFHDIFAAGVSRYGIADLEALARDTHKFECRYLDRLVGPYPDDLSTYVERSPIHHVEKLSCPMLILQGLLDKVVPPQQAEVMVEALKKQNLPYAYLTFADEGHGFRNAASQIAAQEAELSFFGQIFGFDAADAADPEFNHLRLNSEHD